MAPKKESDLEKSAFIPPGYAKWGHLVPGTDYTGQYISVPFLLKIISLTDSVIGFNDAKGFTSTIASVSQVVSRLTGRSVTETHYKQIYLVFGEIYIYNLCSTPHKKASEAQKIIIQIQKIKNRIVYCKKRAAKWKGSAQELPSLLLPLSNEKENIEPDNLECKNENNITDAEITSESRNEQRKEIESIAEIEEKKIHPRAQSILERIRAREEQRRKDFIQMEKEKEKEIENAFSAIKSLCLSEEKRSFAKEFIERKLPLFRNGTISLDDLIDHPAFKLHIRRKHFDDKEYLVFDFELCKESKEVL